MFFEIVIQLITNHALISLTEMIRNALDSSNFACGVFIDLQRAFDTVNHNFLLSKLKDQRTEIQAIKYSVPQFSILGPLLFLKYTDDLSRPIKNLKIHHFSGSLLNYVSA